MAFVEMLESRGTEAEGTTGAVRRDVSRRKGKRARPPESSEEDGDAIMGSGASPKPSVPGTMDGASPPPVTAAREPVPVRGAARDLPLRRPIPVKRLSMGNDGL